MAALQCSNSCLFRQCRSIVHDDHMVDNSKLCSIKEPSSVGGSSSSITTKLGLRTWISHKAERSGRGQKEDRCVIASSSKVYADTTTNIMAREPLTKEDLINHLVSGCKPKSQWRIGTENEKFGFEVDTLRPVGYEKIAKLLNGIAEEFNWDKIMERNNVIGLTKGRENITLEPSGHLEFGSAPVETLHQACADVDSHLYQVKAVADDLGIGYMGMGFNPKWKIVDIPTMPIGRYEFIKDYLPKVGTSGIDVFFRACTVQVNLDFSSEIDMIKKFRASLALQPIAVALFANSAFTEGKPNGYVSVRSKCWTGLDNSRTGMLPLVFENSFGFEQYVDYALDVPLLFVCRKSMHLDCCGQTFRDFMAGKLQCIRGEIPTMRDWEYHLGTIYTEVRLRKYLEMRGADGGPLSMLYALPAFWVGLLYDETSLQNALDLTADWTDAERQMLRDEVPKTGLKTQFRGQLLSEVAKDVVKWAKEGLERRGLNESEYLSELVEIAATGESLAERQLAMYHGKWGQSVDPLYKEMLY